MQDGTDATEREATALKKKSEALESQLKEIQMSLETAWNLNKSYEAQMERMKTETRDLSTRLQDMERQASTHQRRAENAESPTQSQTPPFFFGVIYPPHFCKAIFFPMEKTPANASA